MFYVFTFIISFIVLWKAADVFVDASHAIALHLKLPPILIGATVVAFGTSAPELFVTIFAAQAKKSDVVYGSIFGSNIANIFLIFGLSMCLKKIPLNKVFQQQLALNISALLIIGVSITLLQPSRSLGISCLGVFLLLQYYILKKNNVQKTEHPTKSLKTAVVLFLSSLLCLVGSSKLLISSLLKTASFFGVSTTFLSLFGVAFGTSLPELVTTLSFVKKNHVSIVVGNVFGSNIFNLLFVLPIAWIVTPVPFVQHFITEILILFSVSSVLFIYSHFKKESNHWFGLTFVFIYIIYIGTMYFFIPQL